jgi:hypothetical protein
VDERWQRILIFFASLISALLVILIAVLLTGDSDDGEAASTTTEVVTTTEGSTITEAPANTESADTTEAPAEEPEEEPVTEPEPEPEPEPPPPPAGPTEVGRATVTLDTSNPLGGVDSTPPFIVSLGTAFATSHPWTAVSTSPPGVEGCRAETGATVANPVDLTPLSLLTNWYGCAHMAEDHAAQLHVILVEQDPDRVIVEVVVWDFAP